MRWSIDCDVDELMEEKIGAVRVAGVTLYPLFDKANLIDRLVSK